MNKTELIAAIAERTELSKKDAEKALKAFLQLRENAKRDFDEEMTLDEINEEIQKVRYKEAI